MAAQVLVKLGADLSRVRDSVHETLGLPPGERPSEELPREDIARAVVSAQLAPVPPEKHPACPTAGRRWPRRPR